MRHKAFTLVELFFIVAMISVLAAITVPNFLGAQVRTKVARTAVDMASLEASLRAYYADHTMYPGNFKDTVGFMEAAARIGANGGAQPGDPFGPATSTDYDAADISRIPTPDDAEIAWTSRDPGRFSRNQRFSTDPTYTYFQFPAYAASGETLTQLTTPVAYLSTQLPVDTFADERNSRLIYINLSSMEFPEGVKKTLTGQDNPRYYLLSWGPDVDQSMIKMGNPAVGPLLAYDPTNGTVSAGDIFTLGDGEIQGRYRP